MLMARSRLISLLYGLRNVAIGVVLLATAMPPSRTLAATAASDIPGDPLPGPVAAGRLGGDIYDVVYRLAVPAGHVIVANVTGTAGTDFDLYLFDSTAATVLSATGLVAKSTGSTSTESLVWPSREGGTYYIDLNGATDVEGDYRLTVQIVPDPTPPQVSLLLAGGRSVTNQSTVPVTVVANDDLSGVAAIAFSPDGTTFGSWEPMGQTTTWTFPMGDGTRRLWAKVVNGVGLESAVVVDAIDIDTVAPRVLQIVPVPGASVAGLRPTITVAFSEPIDPATWSATGLIVQSSRGPVIEGTYAYDAASRTGTFVPERPLQAGGLYLFTLGRVTDLAGNEVALPGSWSITPQSPTRLAATAQPSVVALGGTTVIDLALAGAPSPAALGVVTDSAGTVRALEDIALDDGRNTLTVAPAANTIYRFRYEGSSSVAPAAAEARVLVRRSVALAGVSSSVVSRARVGRPVSLLAQVQPQAAGVSVSFRLYRFDTQRRRWTYAGSWGRSTDASGRASLRWTPTSGGAWYWRVTVASTPEYANNISPIYRWNVSR